MLLFAQLACHIVGLGQTPEPATSPLSPSHEQQSFRFADSKLQIGLVAAEPDVVSPVAIAWDANGRMFVAEMSDYPNAADHGRIKCLSNPDRNGHYQKITVFADQLSFPNGVMPWKGGLLVTAAPDIWFLKDTNNDGVADQKEKLLTGFNPGNQQLRVNGLTWGPDNWIYGANGRSEGDVRWADAVGLSAKPVSIRGHDFRFRPETRQFEAIAGRSQFGHGFDDWGNRFLSWNTILIRHEVLPERYLNRNPYLPTAESTLDILEPGDDGRVFPLTPPPLTFNNESTKHFNALAGLTIFRGMALGPEYRGNAFAGEALLNLVHRRVLERNGPTFVARRGEGEKEFLASTDPWFHPVNFATGPDGALCIVDFYRRFVEHPDFVHVTGARNTIPWREGSEHGRIWRVTSREVPFSPRTNVNLASATTTGMAKEIENPNGWWRDTAQHLLVEKHEVAARKPLEHIVSKSKLPEARVQALNTLWGLDAISSSTLLTALRDKNPNARANAVKVSAELIASGTLAKAAEVEKALLGMVYDLDAGVRFQLELTLGYLGTKQGTDGLAWLAQMGYQHRLESLAIFSSLGKSPWNFLDTLVRSNDAWRNLFSSPRLQFLIQAVQLVGANHSDSNSRDCWTLIASITDKWAQLELMAGFAEGLERAGQQLSLIWLMRLQPLLFHEQQLTLQTALDNALLGCSNSALPASTRIAGLRLLIHTKSPLLTPALEGLLRFQQPPELQAETVRGIAASAKPEFALKLFSQWQQIVPSNRRIVISGALRSNLLLTAMLDALEQGRISMLELDAVRRQALNNVKDETLKPRIQKLLQSQTNVDRDAVVAQFTPALGLPGKVDRGGAIFSRLCLQCHSIQNRGAAVGPDLLGISSRPSEAVLSDVLNPNRQVAPEYLSYTVTTDHGEILTGIIRTETDAGVMLRRPNQADEFISRRSIKEMRADSKSLMPDGLEQGLTQQDMADLLQFLKQPDAKWLPQL